MFVILAASFSAASDIYIAQNAAGANTGADCADAHAASWFNTSSNWGTGAGQIGPGTVVHVCGTWTGSTNQTAFLTFQSGGNSGSVVTLRFEPGAIMQAPFFSNSTGA